MIVQPTHNRFESRFEDLPFGGCAPGIGVALASTPDPSAAAPQYLRQALADAGAGSAIRREEIVRERNCAPRLAGSADWHLSLSHSGTEIAAAAARNLAIGIDLERHRPRDFARLDRLLGWTASSPMAFYPRWTLAEALYKAGAGPSLGCFAAADRALRDGDEAPPQSLELRIEQRLWHVRWWHEPAPADRFATTTCLVWSDAP
ncbi:MAG: hypothetical protein AAGG11_08215 [Pseudomonadota bacterium]